MLPQRQLFAFYKKNYNSNYKRIYINIINNINKINQFINVD